MKVRIVTLNKLPKDLSQGVGGRIRATLELASALKNKGQDIYIVSYNPGEAPENEYVEHTGKIHRTNKWEWFVDRMNLQYYLPTYFHVFTQRDFDIDIVGNDSWHLALPKARRRIVYIHGVNWVKSRLHTLLLNKRADVAICCSNFVRKRFLKDFDYPSEKTFTVYNGIDMRRFSNLNRKKIREKLKLSDSDIAFLYVGQINEMKGLQYLIKAFKDVSDKYKNIHLIVVGSSRVWPANEKDDIYESQVRQMSQDLKVHFLGKLPLDEVLDAYAASDIFVLPSIVDEAFPLVVLEAMAAGKPVIASNVGGVPEIVENEVTGLLVAPTGLESLTEAINSLVSDEKMRMEMGKKGLEKVRDFTWEKAAEKLIEYSFI